MQMLPWIKSGLVCFIPDPGDFDYKLRRETFALAEQRLSYLNEDPQELIELTDKQEVDMKSLFLSFPESYFRNIFPKVFPDLPESMENYVIDHIKAMRKSAPIVLEQDLSQTGEQLLSFTMGGNLEMAFYICQITGAYPYTNYQFRWKEIMSNAINKDSVETEVWSPLTKAFQSLDFKFLENISPEFAYRIQTEGRLGNFRSLLRKIWINIGGCSDFDKANKMAIDFSDELYYLEVNSNN